MTGGSRDAVSAGRSFRCAPDISYPFEDNFQIEQHYAGGSDAHASTVREFATRFDLAFGSTKARAYDDPADEGAASRLDD